jgi:hypothetical protein
MLSLKSKAMTLALAGSCLVLGTQTIQARTYPTVVELFTSQGCSSCPPANANLIELTKDPNTLTLSFSVTYWDYLGWKDIFGREDYTQRQATYEPALHQRGPFTPQMVINGSASTVGYDLGEIRSTIQQVGALKGPSIKFDGDQIHLPDVTGSVAPLDVWFVSYEPKIILVPVKHGENSGATLPHGHVVRNLVRLGVWDGKAMTVQLPNTDHASHTAILLQQPNGGPIISAQSAE